MTITINSGLFSDKGLAVARSSIGLVAQRRHGASFKSSRLTSTEKQVFGAKEEEKRKNFEKNFRRFSFEVLSIKGGLKGTSQVSWIFKKAQRRLILRTRYRPKYTEPRGLKLEQFSGGSNKECLCYMWSAQPLEGGGQQSTSAVISTLASGPSSPEFESQLPIFFTEKLLSISTLFDSTMLTQRTVKSWIKLAEPIQYWLVEMLGFELRAAEWGASTLCFWSIFVLKWRHGF